MKENAFANLRGSFAFFVVLLLRKRHKEDAKGTKITLVFLERILVGNVLINNVLMC